MLFLFQNSNIQAAMAAIVKISGIQDKQSIKTFRAKIYIRRR